jgi:type II secretory pathway pseudopilin PulG
MSKIILMNNNKLPKAFSLIELSLLIMLISVILSGSLVVKTAFYNNKQNKITNNNFIKIYQAIGEFLIANKRLPCPASLTKSRLSDSDYGVEIANCSGVGLYQSNSNSNLVYGTIPFKTLNIQEQYAIDGYNSKLIYVIDKRFANANQNILNFNVQTFATSPSNSNIIIKDKLVSSENILMTDAILVLLSYGANKASAFNPENSLQNTRTSDISEQENDITTINNSNPSTANYDNNFFNSAKFSINFDDVIFYKNKKQIIEDFRAHHLNACYDAGAMFGNKSAYVDEIIYALRGCWPNEQRKRLTRKCLSDGTWFEYSPCTFCTIATVSGVNSINVGIGSGSLTCNQPGRSGTVNYQCNVDGGFTTSGNCL